MKFYDNFPYLNVFGYNGGRIREGLKWIREERRGRGGKDFKFYHM